MFRRRGRESDAPAGDAAGTSATPPAVGLTRRERREQRAQAAVQADYAARVARANRRLAQVSGDGFVADGVSAPAPPSTAVPASPPMAHPMPSVTELDPRT